MGVPENAYPVYKSYGRGWECHRGFRIEDGRYVEVDVPPHAHLTDEGSEQLDLGPTAVASSSAGDGPAGALSSHDAQPIQSSLRTKGARNAAPSSAERSAGAGTDPRESRTPRARAAQPEAAGHQRGVAEA